MKKDWFFFPLGFFFKAIGGVPVDRSGKGPSLVDTLINRFRNTDRLVLAITPEGTRKRVEQWHTGFLRIALAADVPVLLGALDFGKKQVCITSRFEPSDNIEADIKKIKDYYKQYTGKYSEQFAV